MSPMQAGVVVLVVLLGVSAAGNALLWHERDKVLEAKASAEQLERDTRANAQACSTSVDRLAAAGNKRQQDLMAAMANIAPTVAAWQAEALAAQRARPDDPKDLCGSLERYLRAHIRAKRGAK